MDDRVKAEFMSRVWRVTALVGIILVVFCILSAALPVALAQGAGGQAGEVTAKKADSANVPWIVMAAAISVLGATFGAGYAVAHVGAAALGAASEKPEIIGRAIVFVGMAEGLVVFGFGIAVMLLLKF